MDVAYDSAASRRLLRRDQNILCLRTRNRIALSEAEPFPLRVETYYHLEDLPPAVLALCPAVGDGDLFSTASWLAGPARAALLPGDGLQLHVAHEDGLSARCVALLPAVYSRLYGSHPGARVLHFIQREEQPYLPIGSQVQHAEVADAVVRKLIGRERPVDVVRASPLDPDHPFTPAMAQALQRHGFWIQFYRHARSHHVQVAGMSFAEYLAQRPRALRETLELNTRLLMQGGRGEFHFPCTPELVEDAWDTFCLAVSRAPRADAPDSLDYLREVLKASAEAGVLRLGIFSLDGEPVAIQLWVIVGNKARCLRIWSVEGQRTFPVDDVLTQLMALCLIDGDHVEELEFGDVDEAFARAWAGGVRERLGLAAFNRRTLRGIRGALRHIALSGLAAAPRRLWRRLTGPRA